MLIGNILLHCLVILECLGDVKVSGISFYFPLNSACAIYSLSTVFQGHGNDVDFIKPKMVNFGNNVKALQVSCGFNHTGAVLEYA